MNEQIKKDNSKGIWIAIIAVLMVVLAVVIGIAIFTNSPAQKYRRQIKLAEKYLDELDYDKAIASYKAAIEIDPKNPEAYEGLADVYIEIDDVEAAIDILESGLKKTKDEGLEKKIARLEKENETDDSGIAEAKGRDGKDDDTDSDPSGITVRDDILENDIEPNTLFEQIYDQSMSAYQGFLNNEETVYDPDEEKELYLSDDVELARVWSGFLTGRQVPDPSTDLIKVSYAYIDCGMDGIPELLISFDFDSNVKSPMYDEIIKYKNGRLEKCAQFKDEATDYSARSDRYGVVINESYWGSEDVNAVDADGNYVALYISDPMIDPSEDDNIGSYFKDQYDYFGTIYKAEIYFGSMSWKTFYSYDVNYDGDYDTAYIERSLNSAGVDWYNINEYNKLLDDVIEEFLPGHAGDEPEWNELGIY